MGAIAKNSGENWEIFASSSPPSSFLLSLSTSSLGSAVIHLELS